jgi:membrane peptidoglycan carboxypeptidase
MASVAHIIRRRRRRRFERREKQGRNRTWGWLIAGVTLFVIIGPLGVLFGSVATAYARAISSLPDPRDTIQLEAVIGITELYDASGENRLYAVRDPLGDERTWISLDDLPDYVLQATTLWEDPNFETSARFNPLRTTGRLWNNLLNGPVDGEHSLTARLVRNVIAPPGEIVSVEDRALEIALVAEVNRLYTPDEILEWHLNTNYYGSEAYGIEAAARVYLSKSARDLTLDEAALLATIPTAPRFNPIDDETAARGRQADLLRRMLAAGSITRAQFEQAINAQTTIRATLVQGPDIAPDFAIYARRQAATILNSMGRDGEQLVTRGGLRIVTTLDMELYIQADCALRTHLARLAGTPSPELTALDGGPCDAAGFLPPLDGNGGNNPPDTGTVVIIDPNTGELLAMLGPGTRSAYQPGPTLHPFVYLAGFIHGEPNFTAASMLLDIRRSFPGAADGLIYIPNNPDDEFRGPVSLRDAMGAGLLPPVTQIANVLNLNSILRNTAHVLGITSLRDGIYDLSLLEKGGAVSVLDVTYSYSVFASLGRMSGVRVPPLAQGLRSHDPVAVRRIEDADGSVLWEYDQARIEQNRIPLLQPGLAYVVNDILSDPATRWPVLGRENALELGRRAAVVHGLTGDRVDNWAVGYTPHLVIGVRLGRAGGGETSLQHYGIEGAAHVWHGLMEYAHNRRQLPPADWSRPEGIVQTRVCEVSGMRANDVCPARDEVFLDASQFPPEDTHWRSVEINTQTGLLATVNTPSALRNARPYFIPPEEAMDWWRANNRPLPPTQYDTLSRPDMFSSAVILQPGNFDIVGGEVDIRGSIDTAGMEFYQLAYGQGTNPASWIDITGQRNEYVPGTVMGTWNTAGLDGTYVLRLTVVRQDGTLETGTVQVTVDNVPPTIVLTAGESGQVFQWPQDEVIPIVAEVSDNISINRVEFYHNGQLIGIDTDYPFGYDHPINRTGSEIFTAVVFDAVGNSSTAEITVEIVRGS